MAVQFRKQGGAANSDPGPLRRWLTSKFLNRLVSPQRLERRRRAFESRRRKLGQCHRLEYFHQVDDPYSHLAAQLLAALAARYDIELVCHLVDQSAGDNVPEPELLHTLSRTDARIVAPHYGLSFPQQSREPGSALKALAAAILAAQDSAGFTRCAAAVGEALWGADQAAMKSLAGQYGTASRTQVSEKLAAGTARRKQLKHYSAAMFYYAGEWYWGVDRLYHLEQRLAQLGADLQPGTAMLAPRPPLETGPLRDSGNLTLAFYVSLRSPYTAIVFDSVVALARETGIRLALKPVLPMVMRGVPATLEKGVYIFRDAAREAASNGVPFGPVYDPIGDPVRRACSLYPWACDQDKGSALLSSFLRCAWSRAVNTNSRAGLRQVVEEAGLDWSEAQQRLGKPGWKEQLENNRQQMYRAGLWGVPGFRLLDKNGDELMALWGQDRLWLVAREIQRQLQGE